MTWWDQMADPQMTAALDAADDVMDRSSAATTSDKRNWSNRFADACALMVARSVRREPLLSGLQVRPREDGSGTESLTFVAAGRRKRMDVIAATLASGLQMGWSLKAFNWRDASGGQFDKNLTGRTYELLDEVGAIHEYQPAAFMTGLYFLPVQAAWDKGESAPSSFARSVAHLRARTGRVDLAVASQLRRCDAAAVGLYVPGDPDDPFPRGVVRYFDVLEDPPRRGLPRIESTLGLDELVTRFATQWRRDEEDLAWAEPEEDTDPPRAPAAPRS